jgi:hypothetical protein
MTGSESQCLPKSVNAHLTLKNRARPFGWPEIRRRFIGVTNNPLAKDSQITILDL